MLSLKATTVNQVAGGGLLILIGGMFFIFSYNSGYGFDGLEYLVIGRSLLDGYPLYTFVPSKSPGLYALIATSLASGVPQNHVGVSAMVTFSFLLLLGAVWYVTKRLYGQETSVFAVALVALSAFTMELNFLEPEGLVASCGLVASWLIYQGCSREIEEHWKWWFAAGMIIGVGCCLKTVAALYWLGAIGFLVWLLREGVMTKRSALWALLSVTAGAALPQAVELAYFLLTARLRECVLWTYLYPLRYYPPDTTYLAKRFIKCGWLMLVVLAAAYLSHRRNQFKLKTEVRTVLILVMGGVSLVSLLKSQASHYFVPSAVLLAIYTASVFGGARQAGAVVWARKKVAAVALVVIAVSCGAAATYRPDVIRRFVSIRDYSEEQQLASHILGAVGPADRMLAIQNSRLLYWVSGKYPDVPFMDTERQMTYWLGTHQDVFLDVLRDPHLTLVEFDETLITVDDPRASIRHTSGRSPALRQSYTKTLSPVDRS